MVGLVSRHLIKLGLIKEHLRFGEYSSNVAFSLDVLSDLAVSKWAKGETFVSQFDPFDKLAVENVMAALPVLLEAGQRVALTSKLFPKPAHVARLKTMFAEHPEWRSLLRLGPSIGNDLPSAQAIEPYGATVNSSKKTSRWTLVDLARELGVGVVISLAPVHPGITDTPAEIFRLIEKASRLADVVYFEVVNHPQSITRCLRAYAGAYGKAKNPTEKAQYFAAMRRCQDLLDNDKHGVEYTWEVFEIVRDTIDILQLETVVFWPDKDVCGRLDEVRANQLRDAPWCLLHYKDYADKRAEAVPPECMKTMVAQAKTALEAGGTAAFRNEIVRLEREIPLNMHDVEELLRRSIRHTDPGPKRTLKDKGNKAKNIKAIGVDDHSIADMAGANTPPAGGPAKPSLLSASVSPEVARSLKAVEERAALIDLEAIDAEAALNSIYVDEVLDGCEALSLDQAQVKATHAGAKRLLRPLLNQARIARGQPPLGESSNPFAHVARDWTLRRKGERGG